jgi:hypothetical protein
VCPPLGGVLQQPSTVVRASRGLQGRTHVAAGIVRRRAKPPVPTRSSAGLGFVFSPPPEARLSADRRRARRAFGRVIFFTSMPGWAALALREQAVVKPSRTKPGGLAPRSLAPGRGAWVALRRRRRTLRRPFESRRTAKSARLARRGMLPACGVRKVGSRCKLDVFVSRTEFMHPSGSSGCRKCHVPREHSANVAPSTRGPVRLTLARLFCKQTTNRSARSRSASRRSSARSGQAPRAPCLWSLASFGVLLHVHARDQPVAEDVDVANPTLVEKSCRHENRCRGLTPMAMTFWPP